MPIDQNMKRTGLEPVASPAKGCATLYTYAPAAPMTSFFSVAERPVWLRT